MGEQRVSKLTGKKQKQEFVNKVLRDVRALEYMLDNQMFEKNVTRIGAEQEMVLVNNKTLNVAPVAMEALNLMKDYDWVETEIAKFNLETNLHPRELTGNCFSEMENENRSKLIKIQERLDQLDVSLILTGILPTLRKTDIVMENLTPLERYHALIESINEQLAADAYHLNIKGIDEIRIKHDSPMIEACNTSFQVHLQVQPDNFVEYYNIAQAIAGPVLAIAANSPMAFGKLLWHETRIAMFQQALDTRASHQQVRDVSPRVSFGSKWIKDSILDIYREDIARFKVLINATDEEDPFEKLTNQQTPKLRYLQVHNGTVYRWNRPCYGISENGQPHLRIENRVFGSGPTVLDSTANAAFWLGLMIGMYDRHSDVTKHMLFEEVHDNFAKAARFGLDSTFSWFDDKKYPAQELISKVLIPIAREGLESRKVDKKDIDRYLNVIQERTNSHMTGARWIQKTYLKLSKNKRKDQALKTVTSCILKNQNTSLPIHKWKVPNKNELKYTQTENLKVGNIMDTDLITVGKDDSVELVAEMIDWKNIRYAPVEDKKGQLLGLMSARLILKYMISSRNNPMNNGKAVSDVMVKNPYTIHPDSSILDAVKLMHKHKIGCLPVVVDNELVGLVTEMDILRITSLFLEKLDS